MPDCLERSYDFEYVLEVGECRLPTGICRRLVAAGRRSLLCGLHVSYAPTWLAQALLSPSIQVCLSIDRKPAGEPVHWPSADDGEIGEGAGRAGHAPAVAEVLSCRSTAPEIVNHGHRSSAFITMSVNLQF
jgi:hypothetical protein